MYMVITRSNGTQAIRHWFGDMDFERYIYGKRLFAKKIIITNAL